MWALTETIVTHASLKVPRGMAAGVAPDGAAHDGGSLIDTLTVPILGLCIIVLPPLQLMTIKVTTITTKLNKNETGRPFSQCSAWANTSTSEVEH
jgi:hypothetical protein